MVRPTCRAVTRSLALPLLAVACASAWTTAVQAQGVPASVGTALTVNPRVLTGGAALVIAGLLLLLYVYRRRPYILYWTGGWMLEGLAMLLAAPAYTWERVGDAAYGLSQFLTIMSTLVFVISADAYRARPRLRRAYGMVLMPVLIWFTLSPLALGPDAVFVPGNLLIAGGLAAAGLAHLRLLKQRFLLGAAIIGAMMLVLAAVHAWTGLAVPNTAAPAEARLIFIHLTLDLVTALGMQLMTFEDMTYELRLTNRRLESAQSDLKQMVTTDALTGCGNRRYFDEVIGRELERHRRYDIPLSLLFVDIDRFKAINDTLGHEAGDRVLQRVAAFLIRNVREADYVFRWGGDEFLILISCREAAAVAKGEELQAAFAASTEAASLPRGVGLSVGCAEVPYESGEIMALIKLADERMYENKRMMRV